MLPLSMKGTLSPRRSAVLAIRMASPIYPACNTTSGSEAFSLAIVDVKSEARAG